MLRQIETHPNYAVSNKDNYVINIKTGKVLRNIIGNHGYYFVNLYSNRKMKTVLIHRLVAESFIPNPENKSCVNHIDGDKTNNNISNLEWCTYQENTQHAYDNGLKKGIINCQKRSKPVMGTFIETGKIIKFDSTMEAGRNGFDNSAVSACCRGKAKSHLGYTWEFIGE